MSRWAPFSDDEIAMLFDAIGEWAVEPNSPDVAVVDTLYGDLRAELTKRRPDDERLLTVLGGPNGS